MNFAAIDWQRPWLAPFVELGQTLAATPDWIRAANDFARLSDLRNSADRSLLFVPQHSLPDLIGYEAHIHATGEVPSRDNLHDFFNALMWLHFGEVKRTLNQLHVSEIDRLQQQAAWSVQHAQTGIRGRQRDAATLFDENAALFISSDPSLIAALRQNEWKRVLLRDPEKFATDTKVILFGHALLEKLMSPYKAITAHVWCIEAAPDWFLLPPAEQLSWLDQSLAPVIAQGFTSADMSHLPVLGVPAWWPGQDEAFYADEAVFRRPKLPKQSR